MIISINNDEKDNRQLSINRLDQHECFPDVKDQLSMKDNRYHN